MGKKVNKQQTIVPADNVEDDAVKAIVDKFLKNDLINNPYIPDFIERRLYANVVKLVLGMLKETVEASNIDILGHRISFTFSPISSPISPPISSQISPSGPVVIPDEIKEKL